MKYLKKRTPITYDTKGNPLYIELQFGDDIEKLFSATQAVSNTSTTSPPSTGTTVVTLTDASTINFTAANNTIYQLLTTTAVGSIRNIASPTGLVPGQTWNTDIQQPSAGGPCAVVFGSAFKWGLGGNGTQPAGSTIAGSIDTYGHEVRSDLSIISVLVGQSGPAGPTGPTGATGPIGPAGPAGSGNGVNLQTGTTYTVQSTDSGKLISFSNASPVAVTVPQATGTFASPFKFSVENTGAGTVTLTPTTSTVDGTASLAISTNQGCDWSSDGVNWKTMRGIGGGVNPSLYLDWFSVKDYGALGNGSTDDTVAIQAAITACAAAGGGTVYFPAGTYTVGGALQDTSRSNAQLILPQIACVSGQQMTICFRGVAAPPIMPSVVGATVTPVNLSIIKGTLNTGSGTSPCMVGSWGPSGSFDNFTYLLFVSRDLTYRMPSNPVLTALDLSHVAGMDIDQIAVDCGIYQIQALTQPTTATSFGIRCPQNGNGAYTKIGIANVIGFYNGWEFPEHAHGYMPAAWGCLQAFNFVFADHASHFERLMAVHCPTVMKFTGGAHYFNVAELDIEHAASGWWSPVYDLDDASNYGHGALEWHTVLAGTGTVHTFLVNGANNVYPHEIGTAVSSGGGGSSSTSTTQFFGTGAGDLSTTSTTYTALTGYTVSLAASVGDIIEVELSSVYYASGACNTKFQILSNGVDLGQTILSNTAATDIRNLFFRVRRVIQAGDLSGGSAVITVNWLTSASTSFFGNATPYQNSLSIVNYGHKTSTITWNPSDKGSRIQLDTTNLIANRLNDSTNSYNAVRATKSILATAAGYFEVVCTQMTSGGPYDIYGVANSTATLTGYVGSDANGWGYYAATGQSANNGTLATYGPSFAQGDVIGVAFKNGSLWFSKNGTFQGSPTAGTGAAFTGITGAVFPAASLFNGNAPVDINAGRFTASALSYTPPTGFPVWDVA